MEEGERGGEDGTVAEEWGREGESARLLHGVPAKDWMGDRGGSAWSLSIALTP